MSPSNSLSVKNKFQFMCNLVLSINLQRFAKILAWFSGLILKAFLLAKSNIKTVMLGTQLLGVTEGIFYQ